MKTSVQQLQESGVYQEPEWAGMWVLDRASRQEPRILMPALGDFKQRVDAANCIADLSNHELTNAYSFAATGLQTATERTEQQKTNALH